MGYIYCITNLINSKRYVGKTTSTIEERWKEHRQDYKKERCDKRPLYDAFSKYGIENFKIECLEEIKDESILSDREIYWINELGTYGKGGYNATKGGDGKILYDHNEILELYNLGYSTKDISNKINCHITTIEKVLKANNIKSRRNSKKVQQYDLADNYIQTFDSIIEAGKWLLENGITSNKSCKNKIRECCVNERKKAYNYIWRYVTIL